MNITALFNEYHEKSGEQQSNVNQIVAASLLHIIGHYFTRWSTSFGLTLSCNREHTCTFYNDMCEKLFAAFGEWPFQIVNVQNGQRQRLDGIRRYNMILVDSYESFLEADISSYTNQNDYNEYYFIFVQNRDAFLAGDMQNIFECCWQHQLINCVIQIQNAKGEVLHYTYFPFMAQHCDKVEAVQINTYNGSSLVHEELFPKKLANLYGCPLRVALWNVPPYLFLSNDSSGELQITGGFEGRLLLELSHKLNFTLDIKVPADDAQRGVVLDNGTLTGALLMLSERVVDMSIGSFRQSVSRSAVATPSLNYYQTTMSLVSLVEVYRLSSMEILFYPFKLDTWLAQVSIYALTVVVTGILKYTHRNNSRPHSSSVGTMDILLMILGMPAIYRPKMSGIRILNCSWMFYALIIRSIYQGYLFHMIRTHMSTGAPQTFEEMLEQRLSMVVGRQAGDSLKDFARSHGLNMVVLNSSSDVISLEYLQNVSLHKAKHFVAALPLDYMKYYVQVHRKLDVFEVLPYNVGGFKTCIYLSKHSYLIDQFDEMLVWIQGSGLLESWTRREIDTYYFGKPQAAGDRLFGLFELYIAFMAVVCGQVIAALVFLGELFYKKRFNTK